MKAYELIKRLDFDFYREKVGLVISLEMPPESVVKRLQTVLRDFTKDADEITLVLVLARLNTDGSETPVNQWHIAGLEPFLHSGKITGRKLCIYGPFVRDGNVPLLAEDIKSEEWVAQALHRARIAFDMDAAIANYIAEQDAFTRALMARKAAQWADIGGDLYRYAAPLIDDMRDGSTTKDERIAVERAAEESLAYRQEENFAYTSHLGAVNGVQPRFV